jgi:uncharacterized protein (TIGR02246 family)
MKTTMKNQKFLNLALAIVLLLIATMACEKEDDVNQIPQNGSEGTTVSEDTSNPQLKAAHGNENRNGAEAIRAAIQQYENAANAGDFELWIDNWAEDGIQMPPNTPPRVGKAEIAAAMQPAFETLDLDIDIYEIHEIIVFGNTGLARVSYSIWATPKTGGDPFPIEPGGKALTIFMHQPGGEWKIVYDCFNSNLPPQ